MPDYKELYLDLLRATEKAINLLIEAQNRVEEKLLSEDPPPIIILPEIPSDNEH